MCELEAELSRLREEVIDQQSLLTTIAQDKETISRCEGDPYCMMQLSCP